MSSDPPPASLPPQGTFVKPKQPAMKKMRSNGGEGGGGSSSLSAVPEHSNQSSDATLGDPMALDKDGYVNKKLVPTSKKPSSQEQNQQNGGLAHFSYMCPGLHGEGTRQEISRTTFNKLLSNHPRFVIPIFQRRYCWKKEQVERWYSDTKRGTRDPMGSHNTGNLILTSSTESSEEYLLIDGQQRVTTTLIFLAAIRDYLNKIQVITESQTKDKNELADKLDSYLLVSDDKWKLCPCYLDRKSFDSIMIGSHCEESSYQYKAYKIFESCLAQETSEMQTAEEKLDFVEETLRQALDLMSVTMVKIENSIDPAQVFLWLQEKSFFNGYQLQNLRPGEFLLCVDLVRNLLLAPLLKLPTQIQDDIYLNHWLARLETKFASQDDFDSALMSYIDKRKGEIATVSQFENMFRKMQLKGDRFDGLMSYSKFVSVFESISQSVADGKLTPNTEKISGQISIDSTQLKTSFCVIDDIEQFFLSQS
eukprot:TRINITY_DN2826_c0_g1_i10.p1 TRINITY_DN2826_c0_g1~~TRINITY_DN2826_c0_g1_i10.p1  ORF type:complete len:478 (-),score=92.41 TRINITY_DN2826_c0_g1_i10:347-1780(-)